MQTHELIAHTAHPPDRVASIAARLWWDGPDWLRLRWRVEGASGIALPALAGRRRCDGLWRTTCFELFCSRGDDYAEFNFSPSQAWAAYDFSGYREGMADRTMPRSPIATWRGGQSDLGIFDVSVPRTGLPESGKIGIAAIVEEENGRKSYWALAHPAQKPDFHHPACFAAQLPPPGKP